MRSKSSSEIYVGRNLRGSYLESPLSRDYSSCAFEDSGEFAQFSRAAGDAQTLFGRVVPKLAVFSVLIFALSVLIHMRVAAVSFLILGACGGLMFRRSHWNNLGKPSRILFLLGTAFATWTIVSTLFNLANYSTLFEAVQKTKYIVAGLLAVPALLHIRNVPEKTKQNLITLFFLSQLISYFVGFWGHFSGWNILLQQANCHELRFCGAFDFFMSYANLFAIVTVVDVALLITLKEWLSKKNRTLGSFVITGLFLTGLFVFSRGTFITIAFGLLPLTWRLSKRMVPHHLAVACLLVLTMSFGYRVLETLPEPVKSFADKIMMEHSAFRLVQPADSFSNTLRLGSWKAALFAFSENSIVGVGYRGFEHVSVEIKKRRNVRVASSLVTDERNQNFRSDAHSSFLEVLADTGVIGFVIYFLLLTCIFWYSWHAYTDVGLIIFCATLAVCLQGLFQAVILDAHTAPLHFLIIGLATTLLSENSSKPATPQVS
jgi:O-antigen ligase